MSRVVWTEHRPKIEISIRPAISWTMAGLPTTRTAVDTSRICMPSWHHIMLNPVRPNLHTEITAPHGLLARQLRPCKVQNRPKSVQRCGKWFTAQVRRNAEIDSLYPVGDESDEKQTPTLHDALKKRNRMVVDLRNVCFCQKNGWVWRSICLKYGQDIYQDIADIEK